MDSSVRVSIIAAISKNNVIGCNNSIPWHLKEDLNIFSRITKHHTVVVGRKTQESIVKKLGQPLPDRKTIVLTRQTDYIAPGCKTAHSLKEALERVTKDTQVFIIGGSEIYKLALPYATRMYLTKVSVECYGDAFFPHYETKEWQEIFCRFSNKESLHCAFLVLARKNKPKPTKNSFVNLENARYNEQRKVMKSIEEEGFCPFCPEHIHKSQLMPIIKEGQYWHLRENRWPYKNTRVHFLLIHKKHVEKLSEISPEAAKEFFEMTKWAEKEFQIEGGSIGFRFGDFKFNGGTVYHLHAHIIVADIIDRNNSKYQPVRFRAG